MGNRHRSTGSRALAVLYNQQGDRFRNRDTPIVYNPEPDSPSIRVAQIVPCTEAEGPGKRFALWFQGCPLRCAGCCNPEMLPFEGGREVSVGQVIDQMTEARDRD